MAKRAKKAKDGSQVGAKVPRKKRDKVVVNLPQTHGANGSSGAGRMELADEDDLGPLELPTGDDAVRVLQELAGLQGQRYRANKDLERLQTSVKKAKTLVEDFDTRISELIQTSTRKADLPLFEQEQAEQDLERIQQESTGSVTFAGTEVPPLALPDAPAPAGDDDAPF